MKPLHEKKISELWGGTINETICHHVGVKQGAITLRTLKRWAIAIVKECMEKHDAKYRGIHHVCQVCNFLIDRFELTEEDLK